MIKKSLKRTTQAKQQTNHVSPPYRSQTLPELDKAETTAQTNHVNGQHRPQTALFQAEGMHCAGCAIIIERKLKKLEGVQDVRVTSYLLTCSLDFLDVFIYNTRGGKQERALLGLLFPLSLSKKAIVWLCGCVGVWLRG